MHGYCRLLNPQYYTLQQSRLYFNISIAITHSIALLLEIAARSDVISSSFVARACIPSCVHWSLWVLGYIYGWQTSLSTTCSQALMGAGLAGRPPCLPQSGPYGCWVAGRPPCLSEFSHQSKTTTRQRQDKCWTCAFLWCLSHQVWQTRCERHHRNAQVQHLSCPCLVDVLRWCENTIRSLWALGYWETSLSTTVRPWWVLG